MCPLLRVGVHGPVPAMCAPIWWKVAWGGSAGSSPVTATRSVEPASGARSQLKASDLVSRREAVMRRSQSFRQESRWRPAYFLARAPARCARNSV